MVGVTAVDARNDLDDPVDHPVFAAACSEGWGERLAKGLPTFREGYPQRGEVPDDLTSPSVWRVCGDVRWRRVSWVIDRFNDHADTGGRRRRDMMTQIKGRG